LTSTIISCYYEASLDISGANAVFIIATTESLKSEWVLFELGASWALSKVVVPILAPGLTEKELPGPLSAYPLVKVAAPDAAARMRGAIKQVSETLKVREKTGGRSQEKLETFIKEFRNWTVPPSPPRDQLTGQFTNLPDGSKVAHLQPVSGVITGLPPGTNAWIIVYPISAPAHWPQPGPLPLDPAGGFRTSVYFGASTKQHTGEAFVVRLVIASPTASDLFRAFLSPPGAGQGLSALPEGVQTITTVTVTRR
jgi:hypothetical protein